MFACETGETIDGAEAWLVIERSGTRNHKQEKWRAEGGPQMPFFDEARRGGFYMRVRDSKGQVLYAQDE